MNELSTYWRFWVYWVLAFLSFPIAGLLANVVGAVTTPVRAIFAGAIAGAHQRGSDPHRREVYARTSWRPEPR